MDYLIDWIAEHSIVITVVLAGAIALLLSLFAFYKFRRWSWARRAKRRPAWLPPLRDTCDWAEDILLYTRGRLSGVARERFEFHLRDCDSCRCQVGNLRQAAVCPHDYDVKSLHGAKPIQVGPGGRLRAHWVHAANEHAKTCPRCRGWVEWLFATRLAENPEVQNLEQQFASAPKTDRT